MIKIQDAPKTTNQVKPSDMEIGDTGIIRSGGNCLGHVVLMTFDGLVSLTNPEHTWSRDAKLLIIELRDIALTVL